MWEIIPPIVGIYPHINGVKFPTRIKKVGKKPYPPNSLFFIWINSVGV